MIKVEKLTKCFGKDFNAVDGIDFEVHKGEIIGFVGQNGAGKTTTIKMLTGILDQTSGKITINGFDNKKEALKVKRSIGYIADNPDMFLKLTGREYIHFLADIYGVASDKREEQIQQFSKRFELKDALDQPMSDYSHGMRQKMMVIAALVHEPPVWILDEPMTGLDPKAAFELKLMMKEHAQRGNCVFFSTHVLEVAEQLCDRILIIKKGKLLFSGTLEELMARYPGKSLEEVYLLIYANEG